MKPPTLKDLQLQRYVGGGSSARGTLAPLTELSLLNGANLLRCTLKQRRRLPASKTRRTRAGGAGARFQRLSAGGDDSSDSDLVL